VTYNGVGRNINIKLIDTYIMKDVRFCFIRVFLFFNVKKYI